MNIVSPKHVTRWAGPDGSFCPISMGPIFQKYLNKATADFGGDGEQNQNLNEHF